MDKFTVGETFYVNGEEFKLISAALHYFRIVPQYWRDRLEKLKALGCNTVETIVPWNIHEPKKGEFNFSGICDIKSFIEIAQELGLYVIIRPSPYICGEWEFGGIPSWLLKNQGIRLRSCDEIYLKNVEDYYKELFKILSPLQITQGGPIIMMQIENELGYFSNDKEYLKQLKNIMDKNGTEVPLFTSNGPWGEASESGSITECGVIETLNFGSDAKKHFDNFKINHPNSPLVCMEYWIGWFDAFGEYHHQRSAKDCAKTLDYILSMGHVNIFVFHGGTNFGFYNGANDYDKYTPLVSSYDYDALLSEDGSYTEKYHKFKKVISKYVNIPEVKLSTIIKKKSYPSIKIESRVSLFDVVDKISTPIYNKYPLSQEFLEQNFGYTLYRSDIGNKRTIEKIKLYKAYDRASFYLNQSEFLNVQYDAEIGTEFSFELNKEENNSLDILMDNVGRVNFHEKLDYQRKGIVHSVIINGHIHVGWTHFALDMKNLDKISFPKDTTEVGKQLPTFSKYILEVQELCDTYLDISKFGKGCVIVNGFNIGRFWNIGPQERLYIPAPLLKFGVNEIIIFETEGIYCDTLDFYEEAKWSKIKFDDAVEN